MAVRLTIPVGRYVHDNSTFVHIVEENRKMFMVFTQHCRVELIDARFTKLGWEVSYRLGVKQCSAVLEKERPQE